MRRFRPYLLLFALALVAFWPLVLHPTQTLYSNSSDLLAEHLPAKLFLVRSLHETGELPLWNPEQYAGSPFVHDIQVGLFYPPHLPLYFLSEPAVGQFLSWLVFAHVVLAGWLMYAYCRHAGMGELGAFAAGCGYMLAPRWMMQLFLAGHTVTAGLAWLPLVLLCVERSIAGRWRWAVGGGIAYAMLVLGTHPQWTFYSSLLIGLWPLRLMDRASWRAFLAKWLFAEWTVVLIGLALCAVQLLPTLEATGESSRSRGMAQSWSLDGARAAISTLIGPFPQRFAEPIHWETRGGIAFTWAIVAIIGIWKGGPRARIPTYIAIGMLAYALGGSIFVDSLPGFSSFRMPTRMLLTLAFPLAFLAGLGIQSLQREWSIAVVIRSTLAAIAIAAIPGCAALVAREFPGVKQINQNWRDYWWIIIAVWFAVIVYSLRLRPNARAMAVAGVLVLDLLLFTVSFPSTRPMAEVYPRSPLMDPLRDSDQLPGGLVYDPDIDESGACFLGVGSPVASAHGVRSVRGYNPLDVARYRQFLAFIADIGEPQKAFSGNFTNPVANGFLIVNRPLFDLLGVAWVVAPVDDPPPGDGWVVVRDWIDPEPRSYNFLGPGVQKLPPMRLYVNLQAMSRAFVVSAAVPEAAETDVLAQLKGLDPWQTATLAGWDPERQPLPASLVGRRWQSIRSTTPNEVIIDLDGKSAGLLVLTDPWYPGWVCRIDGEPAKIWKANYAFRGVMVPAGAKEVAFRFEPQSYRRGKWVSIGALVAIALFGAGQFVIVIFRRPVATG
jgi:Bacterial membrane protein YfhO